MGLRLGPPSEALPQPGAFFEPIVQEAYAAPPGNGAEEGEIGKYRHFSVVDGRSGIKRYQEASGVTEAIAEALGETPCLFDPKQAGGLRSLVYSKSEGGGEVTVVHIVNKNVPLAVPHTERVLRAVHDLRLRLPVPKDATVRSAQVFEPGTEARTLIVSAEGSNPATVMLERVNAYAVISVRWEAAKQRKGEKGRENQHN